MKKIVYFILIGLFSACSNDEIFIETTEQDTCEVTFDVTIPQAAVASRSFNDGTSVRIDSLTLLLFDKNGVLVAKQTATEIIQPSSENDNKGKYKVTLAQSNEKRIAHFVANYKGNIGNSGTEDEILSALNVSDATDAYWQRMVLDNGVYIDKDGTSSIGTVRLIRNFACVRVTDETTGGGFLQGYALVNEPRQGTVAPYYRNAKGGFPSFTGEKTYAEFEDEGYYGVEPVITDLYDTSTPQNREFTNDDKYVYERNHSGDNLENPTFIIVEGTFNGDTYYYRVDIAKDLKYYNLLRNFRYIIQIKSVEGVGYGTAEEAKNGASYNNVDVELKVEEITDGPNTLKVTPTDKTVVNGTTELYINYEYTSSKPEVNAVFTADGKVITNVKKVSGSQFLVTLKKYSDKVEGGKQTETFTITTGSGLSRKVRITLIDEFYFLDPEITAPGVSESYYKYSFTIPSELVESMFPLELLIRESTCSFTPAPGEQMSVELIDDPVNEGRKTWCYKKVLKWADYDQLEGTRVECRFKANDVIENDKIFTVTNKITNEYFVNNGEATLKAPPASIRDLSLPDENME